jgi:hypothetical protein
MAIKKIPSYWPIRLQCSWLLVMMPKYLFQTVGMWVGSHPKSYVIQCSFTFVVVLLVSNIGFGCDPTHIPTCLEQFFLHSLVSFLFLWNWKCFVKKFSHQNLLESRSVIWGLCENLESVQETEDEIRPQSNTESSSFILDESLQH